MRHQRDEAFVAFMADAQRQLGQTAWLLTGDREAAAELLQATLVKTYVAWPRVRDGDALAYARRVMVNDNIDRYRARGGAIAVADPPERPVPDAAAGLVERDTLGRMLATLPVRQRRVLVLRYLHDLSEKQVAAQLDLPLGTVKSTAARGLAALRAVMENEDASWRQA
jgi:RNA polymerase sigma-70 factor (sigma-E family)